MDQSAEGMLAGLGRQVKLREWEIYVFLPCKNFLEELCSRDHCADSQAAANLHLLPNQTRESS